MGREPILAAVILAGYSPDEQDPLAEYGQSGPKGLIPIAGRPMISYVVDALSGSRYVKHLVIVGLPQEERPPLLAPVEYIPPHGGMLDNARAGLEACLARLPDADGVLVCGSDLPLITAEIVDQFAKECLKTDHDLCYSAIERSVMEGRFPTSNRTYVRVKEGELAGGDLLLVRAGVIQADMDLWHRLTETRKKPLQQVRLIGLRPLIKFLARQLTIADGEELVGRALGIRGRIVVFPCAEVGMDVDKPFQLEIARAELEACSGDVSP